MNYNIVYVGMDVPKETFSLCCYTNKKETAEYSQKADAHYSKILNYLEAMRFHYGNDVTFICGYEAGCLGFTLYHQMTEHNVKSLFSPPPQWLGKRKARKSKQTKGTLPLSPWVWPTMITARYIYRQSMTNRRKNISVCARIINWHSRK